MKIETQTRTAGLKNLITETNGRSRGVRAIAQSKKTDRRSDVPIIPTALPKASKSSTRNSVGMFSPGEARCDRWQEMAHAAQTLVAQSSSGSPSKDKLTEAEA